MGYRNTCEHHDTKGEHNGVSKFNIRNALSKDDWVARMGDAYTLQPQAKVVAQVQSYILAPIVSRSMETIYLDNSRSMDVGDG